MSDSNRTPTLSLLVCALVIGCTDPAAKGGAADTAAKAPPPAPAVNEQLATFAGGCFWCMEPPFEGRPGVRSVVSGYTGGPEERPTYEQVSRGRTGHTEAVQVAFDPAKISYAELLDIYWKSMDPTDAGGQFADRGAQYRPGIFAHDAAQRASALASKEALANSKTFTKPIVVEVIDYETFWPAEDYHQDYYKTHSKHYKAYRKGSGREGFLQRTWGDDAAGARSRKTS